MHRPKTVADAFSKFSKPEIATELLCSQLTSKETLHSNEALLNLYVWNIKSKSVEALGEAVLPSVAAVADIQRAVAVAVRARGSTEAKRWSVCRVPPWQAQDIAAVASVPRGSWDAGLNLEAVIALLAPTRIDSRNFIRSRSKGDGPRLACTLDLPSVECGIWPRTALRLLR